MDFVRRPFPQGMHTACGHPSFRPCPPSFPSEHRKEGRRGRIPFRSRAGKEFYAGEWKSFVFSGLRNACAAGQSSVGRWKCVFSGRLHVCGREYDLCEKTVHTARRSYMDGRLLIRLLTFFLKGTVRPDVAGIEAIGLWLVVEAEVVELACEDGAVGHDAFAMNLAEDVAFGQCHRFFPKLLH